MAGLSPEERKKLKLKARKVGQCRFEVILAATTAMGTAASCYLVSRHAAWLYSSSAYVHTVAVRTALHLSYTS